MWGHTSPPPSLPPPASGNATGLEPGRLVVEPPSAAGPHYEQYAKLSRQALQNLCSWRHINFDRYRPNEWLIRELQELDRRQAAEVAPPEVVAEAQARPAATGEAPTCAVCKGYGVIFDTSPNETGGLR